MWTSGKRMFQIKCVQRPQEGIESRVLGNLQGGQGGWSRGVNGDEMRSEAGPEPDLSVAASRAVLVSPDCGSNPDL